MLTIMCPNCRHRFPAPGCCDLETAKKKDTLIHPTTCYYGGLLVPRGYTSGGGCFINGPQNHEMEFGNQEKSSTRMNEDLGSMRKKEDTDNLRIQLEKQFKERQDCLPSSPKGKQGQGQGQGLKEPGATGRDDMERSVTITTPRIQSGGCLIQGKDSGLLLQTPQIGIRPNSSGGGCFVRKKLENEEEEESPSASISELQDTKYEEDSSFTLSRGHRVFLFPPSGCQELPGTRRSLSLRDEGKITLESLENTQKTRRGSHEESPSILSAFTVPGMKNQFKEDDTSNASRRTSCCCNINVPSLHHVRSGGGPSLPENHDSLLSESAALQIQVNATVQLPASLGQCTVNITATTANSLAPLSSSRIRNTFNGGGLVQENEVPVGEGVHGAGAANANEEEEDFEERRDRTPTTPVSWLMPCPWGFDSYLVDRDMTRLAEVKRLLHMCGWYHEGLTWQQSESLLKESPVGRWLMRDSSDSRYTFAVSVQTARGPTSVRVHYFLGRFRLDAEPRLAFAMPHFDCPIKMLEYYVEYSKTVDEHRKEVWVDYSGQLYSEIYLTRPLVKEIRSLSHLARLQVKKCNLGTEHLPLVIRNYLAEYPYTL